MFCPTTKPLAAGSPAVVEIHSDALPNKVLIRGIVTSWRRALPRMRVRAGATVQFAEEEVSKLQFVIRALQGEHHNAQRRRHTRIPVAIPLRIQLANEPEAFLGELREISAVGALIAAQRQPPIGTELVIELTPPGSEGPISIAGRTLYHYGDQTGIKFYYRDGGGLRRLREVVRRLKTL